MAKRPAEDEEDDDIPKIKKRRRPKKKPDDDEESAGGPPGDDEEEDENKLPSSGSVFLDIALDFRDDCFDWAKEHFLYALVISVSALVVFSVTGSLTVYSWVRYINRPSLQSCLHTYDIGAYPEAKLAADEALIYTAPDDHKTRAGLAFVQGAANAAIGDTVPPADQPPYFLAAVSFLQESVQYGFASGREADGYYLLGKALYRCGKLVQCRQPLEEALDDTVRRKEILWYLANAYLFGGSVDAAADLKLAQAYLKLFQNEPSVLEEEIIESYLLTALLELQRNDLEAAEKMFVRVPHFERFAAIRHLVAGEIDFMHARQLRQQALEIENNPNPLTPEELPVLPPPVSEKTVFSERALAAASISNAFREQRMEYRIAAPAPVKVERNDERTEDRETENKETVIAADTHYAKRLIAQMRYADDEDRVIVVPKEQPQETAPQPPEIPETAPQTSVADKVQQRIDEFKSAAKKRYESAVAHFSEVIIQAMMYPQFARTATLLSGICYDEIPEQTTALKAVQYYNDLITTYPTSAEAAAASFILAEKQRQHGEIRQSLGLYQRTFTILRNEPGYAVSWLPKETLTATLLEHVQQDIEQHNQAEAIELLHIARGVIPDAEESRLRGETFENWAALLRSQAAQTNTVETRQKLLKDANDKLCKAGQAFDTYAELIAGSNRFEDNLWRSAEDYRLGRDFRKAVVQYRRYAKVNPVEHRPELELYLGELYLDLDALEAAKTLLEDTLKDFPVHNLSPQLRLVLAKVLLELTKTTEQKSPAEQAKELLQQNLAGEFAPESAIYRDTLYLLGQVCFQRKEYPEAAAYLEDAVKIHPAAQQSAEGYYLLARCELEQKEPESPAAVIAYQESVKILQQRQRTQGLTSSETLMLRNAQFSIGTLLLKTGRWREAETALSRIVSQYQDKPEVLDAMVSLAYALRKQGRRDEAAAMLNRTARALEQFIDSGSISNGEDWTKIIEKERKM